jgi:hypothetical protein
VAGAIALSVVFAQGIWSCSSPSLIEDYTGTQSPEGAALHDHPAYLKAHGLLPPLP